MMIANLEFKNIFKEDFWLILCSFILDFFSFKALNAYWTVRVRRNLTVAGGSVKWGAREVDWRKECFHLSAQPTSALGAWGDVWPRFYSTGIAGLSPVPSQKRISGGKMVKQESFCWILLRKMWGDRKREAHVQERTWASPEWKKASKET